MTCPICDQKPMNCDCTPRERAMWRELQELEDRPAVVLTDEERRAVEFFSRIDGPGNVPVANQQAAILRGLLERTATQPSA